MRTACASLGVLGRDVCALRARVRFVVDNLGLVGGFLVTPRFTVIYTVNLGVVANRFATPRLSTPPEPTP